MNFPQPIPVKELAEKLNAEVWGNDKIVATGLNEIHRVRPGDVTFADVKKYFAKALKSEATILILNEKVRVPKGKALLVCDNPFEAYNSLAKEFRPFIPLSAVVSDTAKIDPTAIIEPNAVIGHHVEIGAHCHIQANAYIGNHTIIGNHVNIQAGAIIGTDAFYYKRSDEGQTKWHSCGRVVIEDHVEVGAGTTINRGVSSDTTIGEGTKIDCQVHIGHGVIIGKHCLLAGQVGIGGKSILEDRVVLYGQVGVVQNIRIGEAAVVFAGSGVSKDLEGGKAYFGSPTSEAKVKLRELAALRHLPEFYKNYYEG
jgi:UDP-3-O-[3-hydroxymyristoyl] glucosamine N-acyltransferase